MIIPVRSRVKLFPSVALVSVLALEICPRIAQTQNATSAPKVDYQRDVQPILQTHCYVCHGASAQMSGLRLDSRQALLAGGNSGKIVTPGSAANSTLYQRVAGMNGLAQMPFGGDPLPPEQVKLIRAWIDQGAEIPETAAASSTTQHGQDALGLCRARAPPGTASGTPGMGQESHRLIHPGAAGERRVVALAAGRSRHAAAAAEPGPHRAAAHARRGRRLPRRQEPRRLREAGRSPACLAALRRALGPHLARRRALRRLRRLREGQVAASSGSIATG